VNAVAVNLVALGDVGPLDPFERLSDFNSIQQDCYSCDPVFLLLRRSPSDYVHLCANPWPPLNAIEPSDHSMARTATGVLILSLG